jgi:hypothetical protein
MNPETRKLVKPIIFESYKFSNIPHQIVFAPRSASFMEETSLCKAFKPTIKPKQKKTYEKKGQLAVVKWPLNRPGINYGLMRSNIHLWTALVGRECDELFRGTFNEAYDKLFQYMSRPVKYVDRSHYNCRKLLIQGKLWTCTVELAAVGITTETFKRMRTVDIISELNRGGKKIKLDN